MPSVDKNLLKATPELEDFAHKYTEEGEGKVGRMLLDKYFNAISSLIVASHIADRRTVRAIEIGCGEGFSTQRLRTMLPDSVQLEASEYVKSLVPSAQKRNPTVSIIEESIYQTTHADNSFDMIFLLEVLEHLDYPDKALRELSRILKPGGYLILGVPREPLWRILNVVRGKYVKQLGNTPGHLNHWSTLTLKRKISKQFGPILTQRTPLPWTQILAKKPQTRKMV